MMRLVKRTERGWAGHFIAAQLCRFRRNTLIECEGVGVVVSTVGSMFDDGQIGMVKGVVEIGFARWYETMAFMANMDDVYKDADVTRQIDFENKWSICGKKFPEREDIDLVANDMHETVVTEIASKMLLGIDLEQEKAEE